MPIGIFMPRLAGKGGPSIIEVVISCDYYVFAGYANTDSFTFGSIISSNLPPALELLNVYAGVPSGVIFISFAGDVRSIVSDCAMTILDGDGNPVWVSDSRDSWSYSDGKTSFNPDWSGTINEPFDVMGPGKTITFIIENLNL